MTTDGRRRLDGGAHQLRPARSAVHAQGSIVFTSGVNANVRATVKSAIAGTSLTLMLSAADAPAPATRSRSLSAAITRAATCQSKFNNLANFRGFPFVPPPQIAY